MSNAFLVPGATAATPTDNPTNPSDTHARDEAIIQRAKDLGPYDATMEAGFARARTQNCRTTYITLSSGDFVEIHDDLDGSYAAFIVTPGGALHPLSEAAAVEILQILSAAQFPVDP